MTRLRDGSLVTLWARQLVVWRHDGVPQALPRTLVGPLTDWLAEAGSEAVAAEGPLAELVEPGAARATDTWMAARLRELDGAYAGWKPDAMSVGGVLFERVLASQARLRLVPMPQHAWPALPSSVVRRTRLMLERAPRDILLFEDVDGASLVLAEHANVHLATHERVLRLHLQADAREAGIAGRLHFVEVIPQTPHYDAAWLGFGPATRGTHALAHAARAVRPGGHIFVSLRAPWDAVFFERLDPEVFSVVDYFREVDHPYLPGGYGLDGGADLVVLERLPGEHRLPVVDDADAAMRLQPHHSLDFDALAHDRLDVAAMDRLLALLGTLSARPQAVAEVSRDPQREIAWWYDTEGYGLVADLRRDAGHLRVNLMPYDPDLEYALLCAVFWALGDASTRLRPQRTRQTPDALILP